MRLIGAHGRAPQLVALEEAFTHRGLFVATTFLEAPSNCFEAGLLIEHTPRTMTRSTQLERLRAT
jgi:hypothetical protein